MKSATKTISRRPLRTGALATLSAALLALGLGCNGLNLQPQRVNATGTLRGTDGTGAAVAPITLNVTSRPGEQSAPRVVSRQGGTQNVQAMDLSVERTGIPMNETYFLLTITEPESLPSDDPVPALIGPQATFSKNNTGDMAVIRMRIDPIDAPLQDTFTAFPPAQLRLLATAALAKVEEDDVVVPFSDASRPLDLSRLSQTLLDTVTQRVTAAVNANGNVRLGGSGNDGDFRLHYVPHLIHRGLRQQGRNVKGFAFIFEATVEAAPVGIAMNTARIYIPVSFLFEPGPAVGGGQLYELMVDPFDFLGSNIAPENLDRIAVVSEGLFDEQIGQTIRSEIVNAISNTPADQLDTVEAQADLLGAAINSFRGGNRPVPDNFDILVLPEQVPPEDQTFRNVVLPANEGRPIRLLILE